jgi:hypothetical protein
MGDAKRKMNTFSCYTRTRAAGTSLPLISRKTIIRTTAHT